MHMSANSEAGHWVEVSGQVHAPTALRPRKEPLVEALRYKPEGREFDFR
jgi:hypothetical protein